MSFGKSSGSNDSWNTASSSSTSQSYTPKQKKWLTKMLKAYGPTAKSGGDPMASYQGQRIADFSPLQTSSLAQAQGFLSSFMPDQGMPLYGETGTSLLDMLTGQGGAPLLSVEQANDTFNQQYVNPAYRNFSLNTAPLIREEFAGPGYWSSARANAVGDAAGDLASQLEAQRAGYLWDTEQSNRSLQEAAAARQLSAIPLGMQYGLQPTQQNLANLQGVQSIFDFGSAEQQQRQAQINSDIQQFLAENRIADPESLQVMLALLGMNYSTSTSSMTSQGGASGSQSGFNFGLF